MMRREDEHRDEIKPCSRCGGRAFYWSGAIVPGNPLAPRGSRGAQAHPQPAWQCVSCGHLEPIERRARMTQQQPG